MPIEWYEVLGATTAGALMAMNVGALVYGFVYHPRKKKREAMQKQASELEQKAAKYAPAEVRAIDGRYER